MEFIIEIPGLPLLIENLQQSPEIAAPILQRALAASSAVLVKNTNRSTVPFRTGFLMQSFQAVIQASKAYWYPTASYARFVEEGTAPHVILPKDRNALFWPGADHPVKQVNHPGTRPNKYMERIVEASQEEITEVFGKALTQIVQAIGK